MKTAISVKAQIKRRANKEKKERVDDNTRFICDDNEIYFSK
jgi:hypothetical protein